MDALYLRVPPIFYPAMSSSFRTSLVVAVAGGALGFVFGLLVAPEEGRKIRQRAAYKLEHVGGQVTSLLEQLRDGSETNARHARHSGDAVVADAEAKAQKIRADIDALLGELKRAGD
jgi:gas vesicle protein